MRAHSCEPALDIDYTSASNSDQLVTQQAIGRVETLARILWSGLRADMISSWSIKDAGSHFRLLFAKQ